MALMISCFMIILPLVLCNPTGCTYDAPNLLYTCDGRGWALPLTFSAFTVQPQRIFLKDVSGELPGSAPNGPTFSGFSSINTALFDKRYDPMLKIMCFANSGLIITKETFTDMGWVEEFSFVDCDILSVPASAFSNLGSVNSFTIRGGSLSNMLADSFLGLDVRKLTNAPIPKGEFIMKDTTVTSGSLPFGILYNINNASVVVLDNLQLTSMTMDTFYSIPNIRNLSISHHGFTNLPDGLFSRSTKLGHVRLHGLSWACVCSYLWFIPYIEANGISLDGDIICSSPATFRDKRATEFYTANCLSTDPCDGEEGVAIGNQCVTVIEMFSYIFTLFVTVISCLALILGVCLYKTITSIVPESSLPTFNPEEEVRTDRKMENETLKKYAKRFKEMVRTRQSFDDNIRRFM